MSQTGFTPEQRAIVLYRDFRICPMCGRLADQVNHRANRGAGGYQAGNRLSNACAICWECNGLIETDADTAELARRRGVKLSRDDDPEQVEYWHPFYRLPVLLLDSGDFVFV